MTPPQLVVLAAVLLALAASGGLSRWLGERPDAAHIADVGIGHPSYAFDPSDDRALAAYATDIFVGRVLAQTGTAGAPTTAPGQELPQTQFAVEVLHTVKGHVTGVVTVNQVGGLDMQAQRNMLLEGDALLRPGATELFLVVSVPERAWYQIVAGGHGHLPAGNATRRTMLVDQFVGAEGAGTDSGSRAQPDDETIDFIRFNGAVYLSADYFAESPSAPKAPIGPQALGPAVGQVVTNWIDGSNEVEYPNEPCSWDLPDGTAPRLAPGDAIYAVRGYSTTFRLAAGEDGELAIYQVWCSDDAQVGADLFDIYGRVRSISVTGDVSESSGFAVIDDRATVRRLVDMLLEGRVLPEELASTAPVSHQMIFHLEDGTAFRASAAPGEVLWGLGAVAVPKAFTETLDRAWRG